MMMMMMMMMMTTTMMHPQVCLSFLLLSLQQRVTELSSALRFLRYSFLYLFDSLRTGRSKTQQEVEFFAVCVPLNAVFECFPSPEVSLGVF